VSQIPPGAPSPEAEPPVELKDPVLAAFLAWLVPGLGHLYQRRTAKAVLYFVCIMGTFVYGLYLGSGNGVGWGRVVYASLRPTDLRLYYFAQIGVGLPAMPALVQAIRVRRGESPLGHFMAPPALVANSGGDAITVDDLHRRLARRFELGTIYTSIAGLLNFLAVFDALAGPVVVAAAKKESDKEPPKEPDVQGESPEEAHHE